MAGRQNPGVPESFSVAIVDKSSPKHFPENPHLKIPTTQATSFSSIGLIHGTSHFRGIA
jgi:hypothetical protein